MRKSILFFALLQAIVLQVMAQVSQDQTCNVPTADEYVMSDRDKYHAAKEAVEATETEGPLVRHPYSERHKLGMQEYSIGTTQMDRKAYADFLYNNCPEAFVKYYQGKNMIPAGWALLGSGIFMNALGWPMAGVYWKGQLAGVIIGSIGTVSAVAGIIVMPVGYYLRDKKAMNLYNEQYRYRHTAACTLNLQASCDGIGIALTF